MKIKKTYVEISDFIQNCDLYFSRAQAGEKIIITVEGEAKSELSSGNETIGGFLSQTPRRELTTREFEILLDMLEPLD